MNSPEIRISPENIQELNPYIEEFIIEQKITPEDTEWIRGFIKYPRKIIFRDFHNFFLGQNKNLEQDLDNYINSFTQKNNENEYDNEISLAKDFKILNQKYGQTTCWKLERALEKK